jgi:hypothetical protein
MIHHIFCGVTQIRFYRCCSYATVPIRVYKTFVYLHRNLPLGPICPEKGKKELEPLDGLSLSHKVRTGGG